jgi:hypothetical protein
MLLLRYEFSNCVRFGDIARPVELGHNDLLFFLDRKLPLARNLAMKHPQQLTLKRFNKRFSTSCQELSYRRRAL